MTANGMTNHRPSFVNDCESNTSVQGLRALAADLVRSSLVPIMVSNTTRYSGIRAVELVALRESHPC